MERDIPTNLREEIDAGVEQAMTDIRKQDETPKDEKSVPSTPETNIPSDQDPSDDDKSDDIVSDKGDDAGESEKSKDDENPISDELLERAVKSGFSLSEARQFKDSKLLESMIGRLDAHKKSDPEKKLEEAVVEDDPFASIPDLDPEEYEEPLVKGWKALKDLAKRQDAKIKELESAGKKTAAESFFDSKVSGLGDSFKSALKSDMKKQTALRKQFDVLTAGYKAVGETVAPDKVFEQAVSEIMGDIISKSKEVKKEDKLRDRQGQFTSRPGNSKTVPVGDALEEIANEIDSKFYGKK